MTDIKFPNGIESFNELNERIMNENINLSELLKGHEGETFYCSVFGDIKLISVNCDDNGDYTVPILFITDQGIHLYFYTNGKYDEDGECVLFPSKDQRDWNKWTDEQKPKVPKTWDEIIDNNKAIQYIINTHIPHDAEKSAIAFIKIHQLIEIGYGGNITNEEWNDNTNKYSIVCIKNELKFILNIYQKEHITFHTEKQREEFLSYSENEQLLKDYYMI